MNDIDLWIYIIYIYTFYVQTAQELELLMGYGILANGILMVSITSLSQVVYEWDLVRLVHK